MPETMGSDWVEKTYLLPDILKDEINEVEWLDKLVEIISLEKIEVLLIGIDWEVEMFARHKQKITFKTGCEVVVSDLETIKITNDKYLTYQFLKKYNLNYPKTMLAEERANLSLVYPCILKPRIGTSSKGVYLVYNKEELENKLFHKKDYIIQEYLSNDEYTCGVIHLSFKLHKTIVLKRKLRNGDTVVAEYSEDNPKIIIDYIQKVATTLQPYGACNFQLCLDKNGTPKIFEINARHSGTTYIRSLFGYKEVEFILDYLFEGQEVEFKMREGIVRRHYEETVKYKN